MILALFEDNNLLNMDTIQLKKKKKIRVRYTESYQTECDCGAQGLILCSVTAPFFIHST